MRDELRLIIGGQDGLNMGDGTVPKRVSHTYCLACGSFIILIILYMVL